ncbi:MAG TPA: hypothetical protein VJ124_26090, partial [Pyrinomonadaceae bacterium]|nr:hypothetical protein [Pyrinomonadaceae bacterium]
AGKPKAYRKGCGGAALQAGSGPVSRRHTARVTAEPHFKLTVGGGKPKAYRKGCGGAALQASSGLVSRRHTARVAAEPHFKLAMSR